MVAAFVLSTVGILVGAPPALEGRVIDVVSGSPIGNVTVVLGMHRVPVADDGRFQVPRSPTLMGQPVELQVEGLGEPNPTCTVTWAGNEPVVCSISFGVEEDLTTTVHDTTRSGDTASSTSISRRQVEAIPVRTAEDALRLAPGVVLVQHGSEGKGNQLFLRGFDAIHGADLAIRVGGVPWNEWSSIHAQGYLDLGVVIPEVVSHVHVRMGPFALDDGAFAMAGAADFELGLAEDQRGLRVDYQAGTTNRHRLVAVWSPEDTSRDDFAAVDGVWDAGFGERREIWRSSVVSRKTVETEHAGRFTIVVLGGAAGFELPGLMRDDDVASGRFDFHDAYAHGDVGLSARAIASLEHRFESGGHALLSQLHVAYRRLSLRENYTGFALDPEFGDTRSQAHEAVSGSLQVRYSVALHERVTLLTGLGALVDGFEQDEARVDESGVNKQTTRSLGAVQVLADARAGVVWSPLDTLRVDLGARLDLLHVAGQDHLSNDNAVSGTRVVASPRVGLTWYALDELQVFASYGRGFRPPEARAFSSLSPEDVGLGDEVAEDSGRAQITVSDAVEIGVRAPIAPWLQLGLATFATFIERESVYDHVSGTNLELNGTRRVGVEGRVASTLATDWTIDASVTWVHARFSESGREVPLVPWLTGSLSVNWRHQSGLRAGLHGLVIAPRPLPHGATGATLTSLDVRLGWEWRWLRLGLTVENVLAQDLREGEYHFASNWEPRGGTGGALPVLHTVAGPPINAMFSFGVSL